MYKLCQNMVFRVVHFQIFWHWLILCKWMFTPDLSDWMAYRASLIPWFWTFSWLCASNVCTPFRQPYAFYAKIYMSHFAYACKMRYPLNLVLESWEYLWFYWTFCIVILDYGLKLHKLPIHTLVMLQKWLEIH